MLYEDLGFSPRGTAWQDVMNGFFDLDGELPVNPDGGLKSFGHPIGASGLRMMYEMWLQLRGEAGPRQIDDPKLGLTHNLGGVPGQVRELRVGRRPRRRLEASPALNGKDPFGRRLDHDLGKRASRGDLHLLVDDLRAGIERAAEHPGKRQHVVDLIQEVAAARGDDHGAGGAWDWAWSSTDSSS